MSAVAPEAADLVTSEVVVEAIKAVATVAVAALSAWGAWLKWGKGFVKDLRASIERTRKEVEDTRYEFTNDHSTNIRDDLDEKFERVFEELRHTRTAADQAQGWAQAAAAEGRSAARSLARHEAEAEPLLRLVQEVRPVLDSLREQVDPT